MIQSETLPHDFNLSISGLTSIPERVPEQSSGAGPCSCQKLTYMPQEPYVPPTPIAETYTHHLTQNPSLSLPCTLTAQAPKAQSLDPEPYPNPRSLNISLTLDPKTVYEPQTKSAPNPKTSPWSPSYNTMRPLLKRAHKAIPL